ncbi:MAG: hypothetical protein Kow0040_20830 [Thermogutta sp.]
MRALGWIVVAVGVLYFAWGFLAGKGAPSLPRLSEQDIRRIAAAAERERGDLLTELADRLPRDGVQVLLMQGVPDGQAVVLAGENDSSGDETATHWPSPWPELNRVLGKPPGEPTIVRDAYAGRRYVHHVYPADPARNHFLVVTELAAGDRPSGLLRWIVLGVSLLLAAVLWFAREES